MTPKHDIKDTYDDVNSSMHSKNENKKEVRNLNKYFAIKKTNNQNPDINMTLKNRRRVKSNNKMKQLAKSKSVQIKICNFKNIQ